MRLSKKRLPDLLSYSRGVEMGSWSGGGGDGGGDRHLLP